MEQILQNLPLLFFTFGNLAAMVGWLLLVVVPRWQLTRKVYFFGGIFAGVIGLAYTLLLFSSILTSGSLPDFSSINGVRTLMADDRALVAGWLHYLCFDLFVGSWQVQEAEKHRINRFLMILPLFFTFIAGPLGLLIFLVIRKLYLKQDS